MSVEVLGRCEPRIEAIVKRIKKAGRADGRSSRDGSKVLHWSCWESVLGVSE